MHRTLQRVELRMHGPLVCLPLLRPQSAQLGDLCFQRIDLPTRGQGVDVDAAPTEDKARKTVSERGQDERAQDERGQDERGQDTQWWRDRG